MEEGEEVSGTADNDIPVIQKIFDSIWLLAGIAVLFFMLSYVVWGMVDLLTIPMG